MSASENIFVLHVSDLHVGRNPATTGVIKVGWNEHDFQLAAGLTRSVEILRVMADRRGADLHLVVSGDLTATGGQEEFCNAQTFLGSRWLTCADRPSVAGLAQPPDLLQTVAGNHDHWGGYLWKRNPAALFPPANNPPRGQFRPAPWAKIWRSRTGLLELELFGIDSNAGLTGRNFLAAGKLDPQNCRTLIAMMRDSPRPDDGVRRVRALMLHHSPSHPGPAHMLDAQSRDWILKACLDHGISAVLCGHLHKEAAVTLGAGVTELRSPATLTGPTNTTEAGFFLHQISLQPDNKGRWNTILHRWGVNSRFSPLAGSYKSFVC